MIKCFALGYSLPEALRGRTVVIDRLDAEYVGGPSLPLILRSVVKAVMNAVHQLAIVGIDVDLDLAPELEAYVRWAIENEACLA
jgi:hypothetical protein